MLSGIKALTFDTGGTILDWHSGVSRAFAAAGARRGVTAVGAPRYAVQGPLSQPVTE